MLIHTISIVCILRDRAIYQYCQMLISSYLLNKTALECIGCDDINKYIMLTWIDILFDEAQRYTLELACGHGLEHYVKLLLLSRQVQPSDKALWFAVNSQHERIVKMLLDDRRVCPSLLDFPSPTCRGGNRNITQMLLTDNRLSSTRRIELLSRIIQYNTDIFSLKIILASDGLELSSEYGYIFVEAVKKFSISAMKLLLADGRLISKEIIIRARVILGSMFCDASPTSWGGEIVDLLNISYQEI